MKGICIFLLLLSFTAKGVFAQYFQFSQYNFSPQRINPASVALSNYAAGTLLYRHQSTDGGIFMNTNLVNASYPLLNRSGTPWSGIGLSFMYDQAGPSGIFSSQEIALSYAITIPVAKRQTLSLGFKGLHSSRRVDVDGFTTGLQFVPERGFDGSVSSGEGFDTFNRKFFTISSGIAWLKTDSKGNTIASFDLSFFDFNTPDESFIGENNPYPTTVVTAFSFKLLEKNNVSLFPEMLFTHNAGTSKFNVGLRTSYEVKAYKKKPSDRVDLLTKYLAGKMALVGVQFHKEKFSFGISYDMPLSKRSVANAGAIEVGLALKKLVSFQPRKRSAKPKATNVSRNSNVKPKPVVTSRDSSLTNKNTPPPAKNNLAERLKLKQDSIQASGKAGKIEHESLVLEKADLRFNFNFNSFELDDKAKHFLNEVAQALMDNPELNIQLVGHTDNVGSERFNLKLSKTRADAVKDYLMDQGVKEEQITSEGKGMNEPLNDNSDEEKRSINRRVEMKITYDF